MDFIALKINLANSRMPFWRKAHSAHPVPYPSQLFCQFFWASMASTDFAKGGGGKGRRNAVILGWGCQGGLFDGASYLW